MNRELETLFVSLGSKDNAVRRQALDELLKQTQVPVSWFDEAFEELQAKLVSEDSFQRSIGMMLLCNLAGSETSHSLDDLTGNILELLSDEKFITRRQCIQNIWKIASFHPRLIPRITQALTQLFDTCIQQDHHNLIRRDIVDSLSALSEARPDEYPKDRILSLIATETDPKLKKVLLKQLS